MDSEADDADAEHLECDVCGEILETDDGFQLSGRGLWLTTRGDEIRFEEPPICAKCSTGIGVFVHSMWMAREEEG